MKFTACILGLCVSIGCQSRVVSETDAKGGEKSAPSTGGELGLDFSQWSAATDGPIPVDSLFAMYCRPGGAALHGPHDGASIVVRVNPEAMEEFKARRPLPAGSVVIKEKHRGAEVDAHMTDYGVMIKREPGYDPDNGDWEYAYVDLQGKQPVERGRIESCIECHRRVAESDYLYRPYLPFGREG